MIKRSDILADMHTHTIASGHAYSTVKENIDAAKAAGLKYLAITDHYFGNGDELDKKNEIARIQYGADRWNPFEEDICILSSAEFNINQEVYTFEKLKDIPWKPVGLHSWFIDMGITTLDDLYKCFVRAHKNGYNAFVHIERDLHKIATVFHEIYGTSFNMSDYQMFLYSIVDYAKDNDIWLELNESSIIFNDNGDTVDRVKLWLSYAKHKGNKIYLGSDAHYCKEIGNFENSLKLLNELEYPKELILNCNEKELKKYFG